MIPSNQSSSSRLDNQVPFSNNFDIVEENIKNEAKENKPETINLFDYLMKKLNICHDRIFADYRISTKIKTFETNSNTFTNTDNNEFKQIYYMDDEPQDQDQIQIQKNLTETIVKETKDVKNEEDAYNYFYKNMSPPELAHIKKVEQKLDINFIEIHKSMNKIKNRLNRKWEMLIKLEKKIKTDCSLYDKNFKMIKDMKETIGENYEILNNSLNKYVEDLIDKNNMIEDIKKYKLLIVECNFLKNCISKYHSIQVMKKNSPICKICFTNISNLAIIPCGHLICNKCLILHKAQSNSSFLSESETNADIHPTSYSITLFNTEGTGTTFNFNGISSSSNNTSTQNNNNTESENSQNTQPSRLLNTESQTQTSQNTQSSRLFSNFGNSNTQNTSNSTSSPNRYIFNPLTPSTPSTTPSRNVGINTQTQTRQSSIFSDNNENRRAQRRTERRRTELDRRIHQRRIIIRKNKCPFCRQEFNNTCRLFF